MILSHFLRLSMNASQSRRANQRVSLILGRLVLSSGLSVTHVDAKDEYFRCVVCLATEVHDDDGLSYALQHLVLQGSKKYPKVSRGLVG